MNERDKLPRTEDGDIDLSRLMFQDPEKYTFLVKEGAKSELRQEYLQNEAQKDWWNGFRRSYPQFNTEHGEMVVRDLLAKNMAQFLKMPVFEVNAELASMAEKTMERLKRQEVRDREHSCIVGGPGHEGESWRPPPMDDDWSLGSSVKKRRAEREAGQRRVRYGAYKDAAGGSKQ